MKQYTKGYPERLRENRTKQARQVGIQQKLKQKALADKIYWWWDRLSPEEQSAERRMEDFQKIFNEPPALIGPVLFSLGWKRKRNWNLNGPHERVWVGPKKQHNQ